MPVYQTNLWICEICNVVIATNKEVFPYDDPVVAPEQVEWCFIMRDDKELLVCPNCQKDNILNE